MKKSLNSIFLVLALAVVATANAAVQPRNYYGRIAKRLADMLPKYHVLQQPLDDTIAQRAWTNLVTYYDFDHSVFLQNDLDRFEAQRKNLDDAVKMSDVTFGFEIYDLYVQRLSERMEFATNLLKKAEWDFTTNETYRIRRKDAPWPKTKAEAEDHWRRRMKNEVLVQILNKELDVEEAEAKKLKKVEKNGTSNIVDAVAHRVPEKNGTSNIVDAVAHRVPENTTTTNPPPAKADTPEESLIKKYRQYATVLTEPDEEAVLQHYLGSVARAYDPHSDYMSPITKKDFDMEMNLALYGVGAVLSMDDGALKIVEIMKGGPVDRDGRIKEGDKIVGVQQDKGEMEDIMWKPMHKTIQKIRGPKGTKVTLQIVPRSDPSGMTKKNIELVRDKINLEDQAATGRVERVTLDGVERKLGYVFLPTFYGTMDKKPGDPDFRSCALDVARYVADFNAQGVEGMILDLRGDGGGSLREAVMLCALFVQSGPVVQIRDIRSTGCLPIPPGNPVAFKKPLIVMTDRASASASEIVAGCLHDTGRAIVVGDRTTHGKGTVQTVLGLGPEQYGSMKITTARFYRINGSSTQVAGVPADIHLPSLLDSLDIGEDKLDSALPFSRIPPADYQASWNLTDYVPQLKKLSEARLSKNEAYRRHVRNVEGMREISDRKIVSLERETRKAQMKADRDLRELDEQETEDDDEETAVKKRRKRNEKKRDDIVLDETLKILSDLVRLNGGKVIPEEKGWWQ